MSYHERRAIVNALTQVLVTAGYSIYLYSGYLASDGGFVDDPVFWARAFLVFIPLSIVVTIIVTIVFTIHYRLTARESEPSITDERDRLIELIGHRNALYVFSIGVVLAMAVLAFGTPISAMFITLIYAGLLSSVVDELTRFMLYRRGF